jgi:hypothetical protein
VSREDRGVAFGRTYRGFVVGLRFAVVDSFTGDLFVADLPARVPLLAFAVVAVFFFVAGFLPVVAVVPDETRVECFARWRTTFLGAASATELSAKAATRATSNIFMVLRIIEHPSEWTSCAVGCGYDNASELP